MHVIAVNGSPRKDGSTARLLDAALDGAVRKGAGSPQRVNLVDFHPSGCLSCYECKNPDRGCRGVCVVRDSLGSVLRKIAQQEGADGMVLLLGSPIYYHYITALMKGFLERLLFPYHTKDVCTPKNIEAGLIVTMSQTEEKMKMRGYDKMLCNVTEQIGQVYGDCRLFVSPDTDHLINTDYYEIMTNQETLLRKRERYETQFEHEKARAGVFGESLAESLRVWCDNK